MLFFPVVGVEARNVKVVENIGHFGVIIQSRLFFILINIVQRLIIILLVLPQAKDYFRAVCVIDFLEFRFMSHLQVDVVLNAPLIDIIRFGNRR